MLTEWIVKRKVSPLFNINPQGSRLRGRPKKKKKRWWNFVQTDINKCKITIWKEVKNRDDWEESIKEVKVCTGLVRRRRRQSVL